MTSSSERPIAETVALFLLLTGLGLIGNVLRFQVFYSIDFLFGSIFSMLALQLIGWRLGILSAAIAASYTYALWNHPYAALVLVAEAAMVGLIMRRARFGLVVADAVYWCVLGMPLVYLFYFVVMDLSASTATVSMLKQAVNGVGNALLARLAYVAVTYRQREAWIPMRELVFNFLVLFALAPSLAFIAMQSREDQEQQDEGVRAGLALVGEKTAANLDVWLQDHLKRASYLAGYAGRNEVPQVQHLLEQMNEEEEDFLRLGLMDKAATAIAYAPRIDELGKPNIGKSFAGRPYLPQLERTLKPMLSEVVMGRVGRPAPVVPLVAPVLREGVYAGFVGIILDLSSVERLIARNARAGNMPPITFSLLDRNSNVVVSNNPTLRVMQPFARPEGEISVLPNGLKQWLPRLGRNVSVAQRWRDAMYVHESPIGGISEWRLVLDLPVRPYASSSYHELTAVLLRLIVVLALAMALAWALSRKVVASLERLRGITSDLPARIAGGETVHWGGSRIVEVQHLIDNFRDMAATLARQFAEVRSFNAALEQEVSRRTRELEAQTLRLQTLLQTATDGIHVLDASGNLIQYSDSFLRTLGYTRDEAATLNIRDWEAAFPPEGLADEVAEVIREPRIFETRHRRKDGSTFDVEISARGIELDGQSYLYCSARDITARKESEAALISAREAAEAANRAKSAFLANMSHEIRTPLNGVIGNAQLLEMTDLNEEQQGYVSAIAVSGTSLLAIINDILDLSKIEAEKVTLNTRPFSLRSCLFDVVRMQRARAADKGLVLTVSIADDCPDALVGDEMRIKQILGNLLSNALKFTARGSIVMTASAQRAHGDTVLVDLAVEDTGIGIPEPVLGQIFAPFEQGDASITRRYGGTGLGLAICRRLAELMGGGISVTSTEGAGSLFRVVLPLALADAVALNIPLAEQVVLPPAPANGTSLQVLLAEDNETSARFARNLLEKLGHRVTVCVNGVAAIEAISRHAYDMVLMDIQMPVMDGELALTEIRARERVSGTRLPVIAVTAHAMPGDERRFVEAGFDGYVAKPIEVRRLQAVMDAALARGARGYKDPAVEVIGAAVSADAAAASGSAAISGTPAAPTASAAPTTPAAPRTE